MLGQFALIAAAVFTGAALLVTVAEQPARLALDDAAMLLEWRRSYDRAAPMQGGLALLTGVLGIASAWMTGNAWTWIGSASILACWPFVLIVVMPVNKRLKALDPGEVSQARPLVERWGRLHAVRTALGALALVCFAVASL